MLIYLAGGVHFRRELAQMQGDEPKVRDTSRRLEQLRPFIDRAREIATPPEYITNQSVATDFIKYIAMLMED